VRVDVRVDPATAGTPTVQITTRSPAGDVVDPVELSATAALPEHGVEPLPLRTERISAGTYAVHGAPLPFPGDWRITVTVRTSDVDSGVGDVTVHLQ
jgi:copper transport protein